VSYYGNDTPLNQVASVGVADARTLLVTPWEKNMVGPIEKAILKSDLGLNPVRRHGDSGAIAAADRRTPPRHGQDRPA
jgi:ribosome recycling factor